jgi:hypothetical protein
MATKLIIDLLIKLFRIYTIVEVRVARYKYAIY